MPEPRRYYAYIDSSGQLFNISEAVEEYLADGETPEGSAAVVARAFPKDIVFYVDGI